MTNNNQEDRWKLWACLTIGVFGKPGTTTELIAPLHHIHLV